MGAQMGPALNSSSQNANSTFAKITYDGLFNENYFQIKFINIIIIIIIFL